MSGRFTRQQRRKRWADTGIAFPQEYVARVTRLKSSGHPLIAAFAAQLLEFSSLSSTYNEIVKFKSIAALLSRAAHDLVESNAASSSTTASSHSGDLSAAVDLFLELLFLENSRPLHQHLLTTCIRLPALPLPARLPCASSRFAWLAKRIARLCQEYSASGPKARTFALVGVTSSLIGAQFQPLLSPVTRLPALLLARELCGYVSFTTSHSVPAVMDECQEALSALFFLQREYGDQMLGPGASSAFSTGGNKKAIESQEAESAVFVGCDVEKASKGVEKKATEERGTQEEALQVYCSIVTAVLEVLQSGALTRECDIAASVSLCAAILLGSHSADLALELARTFFSENDTVRFSPVQSESPTAASSNQAIERQMGSELPINRLVLNPWGSDLRIEYQKCTEFGQLCILRSLLTTMPRPTLNQPLLRQTSPEPWTLLYEGILPSICALCEESVDAHFKFHAITCLQVGLQQVKASLANNLAESRRPSGMSMEERSHQAEVAQESGEQGRLEFGGEASFSGRALDPGRNTEDGVAEVGELAEGVSEIPRGSFSGTSPASKCGDEERQSGGLQLAGGLSKEALHRVLQIVWNNWEDPLTQTVKQIQVVFDLLVELQCFYAGDSAFLEDLARDLLAISAQRKGRYMPLAAVANKMGATWLLERSPRLVRGVLEAMVNDSICCQAQTFLKAFLERLRSECWISEGGAVLGDVAWRQHWMPHLLDVLLASDERLRSHLAAYVLPLVLSLGPDSLQPLLSSILSGGVERDLRTAPPVEEASSQEALAGADGKQQQEGSLADPAHLPAKVVPALVVTLKVARSLGIIEGGLDEIVRHQTQTTYADSTPESNSELGERASGRLGSVRVPLSVLEDALCHAEESLRVSAAELVCLNPKNITMPCELELRLLRKAIPLNLRPSSTGLRMKWASLLRKFFGRVKASADHWSHQTEVAGKEIQRDKYEGYKGSQKAKRTTALREQADPEGLAALECLERFMRWLSQLLLSSLYPSAPYERKQMAMELLGCLLDVWEPTKRRVTSASDVRWLWPYEDDVTGREATLVLVGAVVDSWDRLREGAFGLLLKYPTPLPGLESPCAIEPVLAWAKSLVYSPRVRESDAGSLVLRLLFRKYVVELGWRVKLHLQPDVTATDCPGSPAAQHRGAAIVAYLEALNDWLEAGIDVGKKDLQGACEHALVHGVLLATRYTVDEIDWRSDAVFAASEGLRASLRRLLALILRVTGLALWVVSVNALNLKELKEEPAEDIPVLEGEVQTSGNGGLSEDSVDKETRGDVSDMESENGSESEEDGFSGSGAADYSQNEPQEFDDGSGLAPREQMVMVACWLSMKEVSLLLGTVTRRVPLQGGRSDEKKNDSDQTESAFNNRAVPEASVTGRGDEGNGECRTENGRAEKGRKDVVANGGASRTKEEGLLDLAQLREIGDHFVTVLLGMKHNGAIDKTQLGFVALCERLLKCGTPELAKLPEQWMHRLMAKAGSPGQGVDDLIRRSAGIPAAFLALFEAEPDGAPKRLLQRAMPWLLSWARGENPEEKLVPGEGHRGAEAVQEVVGKKPGEDLETGKEVPGERRLENGQANSRDLPPSTQQGVGGASLNTEEDKPSPGGRNRVVKAGLEGMVPQVHAFNTLRVTFGNTNLGTDTTSYAADGLMAAVKGFASPHWEVRNAASLAYSALVLRMVGCLNVRHSERAHRKGIACHDFFNRYPLLHPFLLNELRAATWQLENPATQRSTAVHPSLYPVLMLLARLRPSVLQTAKDDVNTPVAFVPFVMRCATQRNAHVRALASRALAPLVPPHELLPLLRGLLLAVPPNPGTPNPPLNPPNPRQTGDLNPSANPGCNAVHGSLLQASALLNSIVQWTDVSSRLAVLSDVLALVEARAWMGSLRRGCRSPLVTVEFLKLLGVLQEVAMGTEGARNLFICARTLLLGLCREVMNPETSEGLSNPVGVCVGLTDLQEKATLLYFGCLLGRLPDSPEKTSACLTNERVGQECTSAEDITKSLQAEGDDLGAGIERALSDPSYEVRLAVLKRLKQSASRGVVGRGVLTPLEAGRLQKTIVDCVQVETHPKCVRRALRVLFLLSQAGGGMATGEKTGPAGAFGMSNSTEAVSLWATLFDIYSNARQSETKEAALCCLGTCLKHLLAGERLLQSLGGVTSAEEVKYRVNSQLVETEDEEDEGLAKKVSAFLKLVKKHSRASESVSFRSAAAGAVVASGLLELASTVAASLQPAISGRGPVGGEEKAGWQTGAVLEAWFLSARLLEDEDADLRESLARRVTAVIEPSTAVSKQRHSPPGSSRGFEAQSPSQVEQTLVRALEHLTALFGSGCEAYIDRLAGWIHRPRGNRALARIEGYDLVRRLFDKELDNHHEEDALFAQLASKHLQRILCKHGHDMSATAFDKQQTPGSFQLSKELGLDAEGLVKDRGGLSEGAGSITQRRAGPLDHVVRTWRKEFSAQLDLAVRGTMRLQKVSAWVGGVTNHADAFAVLYRALLGLLTFAPAPCPSDDVSKDPSRVKGGPDFPNGRLGSIGSGSSEREIAERKRESRGNELEMVQEVLVRAGKVLFGLVLNPLIAKALLRTLAMYEVPLERVIMNRGELEKWRQLQARDFNPCFLMVVAFGESTE